MKLLLINGNTTQAITDKMADAARLAAGPDTHITAVTATFGARVVSSRSENAVAAHAVVTLAAQHHHGCDAVLIGVSLDTALGALRELLPMPVIGMTEAAALVACTLGGRFGVITLGKRTLPMYEELLASYGLEKRVAAVEGVDIETRDYGDSRRIADGVVALASTLVQERGAEAIVLAGAAMAGQHRELQARIQVPLLDGITCGVMLAELVVKLGLKKPQLGSYSHPGAKEVVGVDPDLVKLYRRAEG
jgi:allantoin racemase